MALTEYRKDIEFAAKEHGIDPDLLEALVLTESSGKADAFRHEPGYYERYLKDNPDWAGKNPRRVSSSYGLCQVMYPTARQYGLNPFYEPEMLFLPQVSLDFGAKILANLLKRYKGNVEKALQAYNGGHGGVGKPITKVYSEKVLQHLARVRAAA